MLSFSTLSPHPHQHTLLLSRLIYPNCAMFGFLTFLPHDICTPPFTNAYPTHNYIWIVIIIWNCSNLSVLLASFNSLVFHSLIPHNVTPNLSWAIDLDPFKVTNELCNCTCFPFTIPATLSTTCRNQYLSRLPEIMCSSHSVWQSKRFVVMSNRNWHWLS